MKIKNIGNTSILVRILLVKTLENLAINMSDSEILYYTGIFDEWQPNGKQYRVGSYISYGTDENDFIKIYKIKSNHISQSFFKPDETSERYQLIGYQMNHRIWVEPLTDNELYQIGDIVSWYENDMWVLKRCIDENNIWSPSQIGWEDYEEII